MEAYKTISGVSMARIVEKKSEFIANAAFVETEQAALSFLEDIKSQHRSARHNVYAYVLREGGRTRCSDDGEPAKTAGVPTLEVITHANLTNCIIVTTRYFGGTLLGTGGLVRAYTQAAKEAILAAKQVCVQICVRISLKVPYAFYEQAVRIVENGMGQLQEPVFADVVTLQFVALEGTEKPIINALTELMHGDINLQISQPYYAPL